jgi:hypothetical protein
VKTALAIAILLFVAIAVWQLFLPRRLPNAFVFCLCAWVLARVRKAW